MSAQSASNKGLGRGLDALLGGALPPSEATQDAANAKTPPTEPKKLEKDTLYNMPVSKLVPSDAQPRRVFDEEALSALASSIKSQGVLQPLVVRAKEDKFEIIAGERRWRAAQMAGLSEVPVIIREFTDARALEVALVENVQRMDLNPIDEATGYLRLVNEFNYTHEEMARVTGKSRSHITNLMRLLALPDKVKDAVSNNLLTMGHARALLGVNEDAQVQLRAAQQVIKNRLSVRETEDLIRKLTNGVKSTRGRKPKDPVTAKQQEHINTQLGVETHIKKSIDGTVEFRLNFANAQEFENFVRQKLAITLTG